VAIKNIDMFFGSNYSGDGMSTECFISY